MLTCYTTCTILAQGTAGELEALPSELLHRCSPVRHGTPRDANGPTARASASEFYPEWKKLVSSCDTASLSPTSLILSPQTPALPSEALKLNQGQLLQ